MASDGSGWGSECRFGSVGFRVWGLGFIEIVKGLGAKNVLTETF